jgi:hypothetical protein
MIHTIFLTYLQPLRLLELNFAIESERLIMRGVFAGKMRDFKQSSMVDLATAACIRYADNQ